MIYLETATQIFPGKFEEYMDVWSKEILPRYEKAGRKLVAHWQTYIGEDVSEIVAIWGFSDLAQMQKSREAMRGDKEFVAASRKIMPFVAHESRKILEPTSFSPLR